MIRIIDKNGKDVFTIKDNGDTVIDGVLTTSEEQIKEAFNKAAVAEPTVKEEEEK